MTHFGTIAARWTSAKIDPEDVLVDWETVEPTDISGEVDENFLRTAAKSNKDDKVLVSIRVRPSEAPSAWDSQANTKSIKLLPQHHRNAATTPPIFNFDEILTGSDNKSVYNAVARNHVCAAMDGYNSVIFAYGQTASGKTFTLVCLLSSAYVHVICSDAFCSPVMTTSPESSRVP
jgi:centromeric protein E